MSSEFIEVNGQFVHVERIGDPSLPTVVFLHGFTGSTATWNTVVSLLEGKIHAVTIDLWGHGRSDSPESIAPYTMEQQIEDLETVFKQLKLGKLTVVGYSMGGRTALAYAAAYRERIQALVLESASPGLKTEAERTERKQRDAQLANRLLEEPIIDFVDFWEGLALFESQKSMSATKKEAVRQERMNQNPKGLANSLLGIGTGSQPSNWEVLSDLKFPVLLITGTLDSKFQGIANEMKESLPNVQHYQVKNAGHAIHVEKPEEFATIIEDYVKQN